MISKLTGSFLLVWLIPMTAAAQSRDGGFVQGFGGLRLDNSFVTETTFGGSGGGSLTPYIQAVGEVGRISNVMPATLNSILSFSPVDVAVSAWYGEGGIRLLTTPASPIRAYGETTAGVASLRWGLAGIGSEYGPIVNAGLRFLDRTEPLATLGGGVILQHGAFIADVGYRFSRIFANDAAAGFLSGGNVDVHSVRVGIGVRF